MSNFRIESAWDLAHKNPEQFLSEVVFKDFYVDEFKFGPGTSGKLGLNMISQYVVVPAHTNPNGPNAPGNELAIHLNCLVKPSQLGPQRDITIHVKQFHITARSLATQRIIDANGPSTITAGTSIHMNVNTGWGRAENLRALAQEVGINDDQTLHAEVRSKQGYNSAYMRGLVKVFKDKVTGGIDRSLGKEIVVKWEDDDKTFPTA